MTFNGIAPTEQPGRSAKRPTIAYLSSEVVVGTTPLAVWSGVVTGAMEYDLNLIGCAGGNLMERQANIVYDLVTPEVCSGIIAWSIARGSSDQELEAIHARYQPLPLVTVSRAVAGHPVVMADNYQGMREAVTHLIETHGCRHLAFIRGPEVHFLAEERYRAYLETLEHYQIPFNPALVTPAWDWSSENGERAVALFLDERGLRPGKDLDAIVAASDVMAVTALEALQSRGIRIPKDLVLAGFNNSVEAQCTIPSITSVAPPLSEQGRQAVGILAKLLEQTFAPEKVLIPTHLVVHQSCGCLGEAVVQAGAIPPQITNQSGHGVTFVSRRDDILQAMIQMMGVSGTFHVFLPLPNLADKTVSVTAPTQSVLLLISAMDQPPAEIVELGRRQGLAIQKVQATDDFEAELLNVQPAALVWDLTGAGSGDWAMVRRLCNHPRLSRSPFILYGQVESGEQPLGLTSMLVKPTAASTLLGLINALRPQEITGPILIVDDDPAARQAYRDVIAQGLPGYPVCAVNDGEAALTAMAEQIPSLVLLDLMMPNIDGFDTLDRMRADPRTQTVPVIILTSKVLNLDDIKRIEQHARVVVQSKDILDDQEIIAALHHALFGTKTLPPQTSAVVKRAVAYLHQNYAHPLKRWEIAEAIGVSENYLSRVFNQELGLSPWDYLNRFRVCRAKELFRGTKGSIKNVAEQVGFKDEKYFSRVFHKLTGLSPREFKEHA